ncbi:MAG: hypothetical protein QM578_17700 [Pantoea sp.]|uniref:hypothetical protein n=1 Tax=Pantoea sp. TaxID=69393 RepID=UPI0039E59396
MVNKLICGTAFWMFAMSTVVMIFLGVNGLWPLQGKDFVCTGMQKLQKSLRQHHDKKPA